MNVDLKRLLWLVALVVLLAIPVALLLSRGSEGLVRDVIAVPFTYLAWIGRLYLRTVPRALFWGALLLFGLVLAITNVLVGLGGPSGRGTQAQRGVPLDRVYDGQVQRLTSQIHYAARSTYFRRRLAQRLGRLILRALDYEEPYGPEKVERGLAALDAPPEIRAFLREGGELISPSRPAGFIAWLRRLLQARRRAGGTRVDLERVVRFLEESVEVS